MRLIERSEYRDENGEISLEARVRATLEHGLSWYGGMKSQELITRRLDRSLEDDHLLICNATLPGTETTIPMILLSPSGVRVLVPVAQQGVFRAKEQDWYVFNDRTRKFRPARPNLQQQAAEHAAALHSYLQQRGVPLPEVEAVAIFTHPRTIVDTVHPTIRIVQADAIEHFANNLARFQVIMDDEDIAMLREIILEPPEEPLPELEMEPEARLAAPPVEESLPPPVIDVDPFRLEDSPAARERRWPFGLQTSQVVVLGLLLILEILVVGVFAALLFADRIFSF